MQSANEYALTDEKKYACNWNMGINYFNLV